MRGERADEDVARAARFRQPVRLRVGQHVRRVRTSRDRRHVPLTQGRVPERGHDRQHGLLSRREPCRAACREPHERVPPRDLRGDRGEAVLARLRGRFDDRSGMALHRRAEVRGVVALVVSHRATEGSLEHLQRITLREPAQLDLAGGAEHDRRARQKREGASRQRTGKLGGDGLGRSREVVEHDHGPQRAEFALDHRLRRAPGRPARPERAVDVELEVVEVGIGRADTHRPVRQRRRVVRECMPPDVGLADPPRPAEHGDRVGGQ